MRLPDGLVERAQQGYWGDPPGEPEHDPYLRAALSAALSPEAIRELACGPCPFCEGNGDVPNPVHHPEDALDGPFVPCPACKGHGSLVAAWLSEPAVLEAASMVDRRWRVDPCLSAAAGALSERSGE